MTAYWFISHNYRSRSHMHKNGILWYENTVEQENYKIYLNYKKYSTRSYVEYWGRLRKWYSYVMSILGHSLK